jgi:hypothetical protein
MNDGVTQEGSDASGWMLVQAVRLMCRQIRTSIRLGCDGEGKFIVPKVMISHCQEKPLVRIRCPYRKPTQVGEKRILRRAEELSLRNSAK